MFLLRTRAIRCSASAMQARSLPGRSAVCIFVSFLGSINPTIIQELRRFVEWGRWSFYASKQYQGQRTTLLFLWQRAGGSPFVMVILIVLYSVFPLFSRVERGADAAVWLYLIEHLSSRYFDIFF